MFINDNQTNVQLNQTKEYIRDICRTQERTFKYAAKHNFDMEDFTKAFMYSDVTNKDMDGEYSPLCCSMAEEVLDAMADPNGKLTAQYFKEELYKQGKELPSSKDIKFDYEKNDNDIDRAGWIGYIYRLLQIRTHVSSREIYDCLPYSKMKDLWIGGHTIDDELVINDLKDLFEINEKNEKVF